MNYDENIFKEKANRKARKIWLIFALLLSANYGSDVANGLQKADYYIIFLILCWLPIILGEILLRVKGFTTDIYKYDLVIGYDEALSRPLNLTMERGEKVVLKGANGIGKTTLLKSILGLIPSLGGDVELGDYLEIGYFEQEMPKGNTNSCIQEIWEEFPSYTQYEVRAALAKCGLTTQHIESLVRVLSGGEQAKVRLCKLINRETNLLVLDEPTNHLDVDAKEELKNALKEYKGTVLMVCHEPEFYDGLATSVWDCSEWTTKVI